MADDLDDFFNEVEEVEAKVSTESQSENNDGAAAAANGDDEKKEDAEAKAAAAPPAKKHKPNPPRPRGVVVAAASSSAKVSAPSQSQSSVVEENNIRAAASSSVGPSLGPQPPTSSIGPTLPASAAHLPPLPPGIPPPPPPPPLPTQNATTTNNNNDNSKPAVRMAAGKKWVDPTLNEWPENDYRIFVGNLPNDVTDIQLYQHFAKYPSLVKAKVVRHADNPEKSKGYGFVSLLDPLECAKAIREMDQSWLSSRPIRVKRSDWKERDIKTVRKKQKKEKKQQKRFGMM